MAMKSVTSTTRPDVKGERKYHNTHAAYSLPNDDPEHARLEAQADLLRELMQEEVIHAPVHVPSVHKALDIGCGTGTVTHDIAAKFSDAHVYGLDLSPMPSIRDKLPNIEYIQGNFNELSDPRTPDPRFKEETFDFIFSRLLVAGMTDWKGYIERCVALTKPGGCIEMHDIDASMNRIPTSITPAQREALYPHSLSLPSLTHPLDSWAETVPWTTTLQKVSAAQNMDATCGRQLARLFVEAGLEDVQVKRYMYPHADWDGFTDFEKRLAVHYRQTLGAHMPVMIRKVAAGQDVVSAEEVEEAAESARKYNEDGGPGCGFWWLYVVCGRKGME